MHATYINAKLGSLIKAKVTEVMPNGDIIASFDGKLIRVGNKSQQVFCVGELVPLIVKSLRPLSFRLASVKPGRQIQVSV